MIIAEFTAYVQYISSRIFLSKIHLLDLPALFAKLGLSFDACFLQGDKNIIKFEGDHNSPRPQFYFDSINIFFHNVLQPPEDEAAGSFFDPMDDYFGKVKHQ
jgi:hypothetical protein